MSDPSPQTIVIVGAGQAGGQLASELRVLGYQGRIVIVGDEPHPPYKRPPLSKAYLTGGVTQDSLHVMPPATLAKSAIECIAGVRATRIDRAAKVLELADGRRLPYDKLALATGGRARPLNVPGANRPNVFLLRTIADVEGIRRLCAPGRRAVIVGGGFIGLEVAASLRKLQLEVTVLEGLPRVLARVTVPEVSAFYERVHREAGVDLRTGVALAGFEGPADPAAPASHALLGNGEKVAADFFVIGIGLIPNTELAEAAGLAVDNGIVVDEHATTSDPDIMAAGDCTNHPNAHYGRRLRLESVPNAMEQARAAAAALCGKHQPYHAVPWFWSDQYDLKLQMVGLSEGHDRLVFRGDPASQRSFALFYLKDGKVLAADTVSRPADFAIAKKMVALKVPADPGKLADESVPLKGFLPLA